MPTVKSLPPRTRQTSHPGLHHHLHHHQHAFRCWYPYLPIRGRSHSKTSRCRRACSGAMRWRPNAHQVDRTHKPLELVFYHPTSISNVFVQMRIPSLLLSFLMQHSRSPKQSPFVPVSINITANMPHTNAYIRKIYISYRHHITIISMYSNRFGLLHIGKVILQQFVQQGII